MGHVASPRSYWQNTAPLTSHFGSTAAHAPSRSSATIPSHFIFSLFLRASATQLNKLLKRVKPKWRAEQRRYRGDQPS
jgi:hypothetical protein